MFYIFSNFAKILNIFILTETSSSIDLTLRNIASTLAKVYWKNRENLLGALQRLSRDDVRIRAPDLLRFE